MDGLNVHEMPAAKLTTMTVAFAGWPDAAEAATGAVDYLVEKLPAKKFAQIDPEEFYDFTVVRPQIRQGEHGERVIHWPANDFYYYAPEDGSGGLVLYSGTEPNLKWRTFSGILTGLAEQCGVERVVSLGALGDAIPHTRDPWVSGRASSTELVAEVERLGVRSSAYQGPTGIHTALMDACAKRGLAHASLWGHSPHYITARSNPKVTYALLTRLIGLVDCQVDLEPLRLAGRAFEEDIGRAIAKQDDVTAYVQRLERRYDAADQSENESADIPSPEAMVKELEDFLKRERRSPDQPGDSSSDTV
jgi:proteasome assembly chaperone (PAC2) family protein